MDGNLTLGSSFFHRFFFSVFLSRAQLDAERSRHNATAVQLEQLSATYEQLLRERGEEKFGARRVTLLKAQNMQMERQVSAG